MTIHSTISAPISPASNTDASSDDLLVPNVTTITVDLRRLPALVIGNGPLATRRILALLDSGATVTVIAPTIADELQHRLNRQQPGTTTPTATAPPSGLHREQGRLTWHERAFRFSDVGFPATLIVAATDDPDLNARIVAAARRAGKLASAISGTPVR